MLINGLGIGVPYGTSGGGSGGSGSILATSSLYLPLKSTIVPTRGASTPTFTRATAAWDFDNEGKLNLNIPSGVVRFTGARFVRNIVPASEDVQAGGWTKSNLTATSATELVENGVNSTHQLSLSTTLFGDYLLRADIKRGVGSTRHVRLEISGTDGARVNFNVDTGAATTTAVVAGGSLLNYGSYAASAGYTTFWILVRIPTSQTCGLYAARLLSGLDGSVSYAGDSTSSFHVTNIQVENVSGQADQTASEYVSVGVLSAPFHGAGVDGCKYFATNKNGTPIYSSVLKKYLSEPSRVNNCLWGRDQRGMASNTAYTSFKWEIPQQAAASELITNGSFTAGIADWTAQSGATLAHDTGRLKIITPGGAFAGASTPISCTVGKTYSLTLDHITGDANLQFGVGSGAANPTLGYSVFSGTETRKIHFLASHATMYLFVYFSSGVTVGKYAFIDNVSVKEAAIQVTATTGLDNVANSASRLTAAENDATLLQLLTAATGTRTTSVWIKRISGSGTVSLTRNGGTNWTDITASLVTDTWVPVEVVSDVGANPTVGLKMGTSGDVIDVDCFQDEDGAWRTSPILTTTAAVTRNGDVLSYATAFDVAQGTALCSATSATDTSSGGYLLTGDANGRFSYLTGGSPRTYTSSYDGTLQAGVTGKSLASAVSKRVTRWGVDQRCCADGTLGGVQVFDGTMGAATTLYVGCSSAGVTQLSGNIGEVHIWNTPLTDAQMQQVTT